MHIKMRLVRVDQMQAIEKLSTQIGEGDVSSDEELGQAVHQVRNVAARLAVGKPIYVILEVPTDDL